jgi:hypothetical protein
MKIYKMMRIADALKPKNFGVFRAADVDGLKSPIYRDDAPCMLANCTADEARRYVRELECGATVEEIRARRQHYKNMQHSGMN